LLLHLMEARVSAGRERREERKKTVVVVRPRAENRVKP